MKHVERWIFIDEKTRTWEQICQNTNQQVQLTTPTNTPIQVILSYRMATCKTSIFSSPVPLGLPRCIWSLIVLPIPLQNIGINSVLINRQSALTATKRMTSKKSTRSVLCGGVSVELLLPSDDWPEVGLCGSLWLRFVELSSCLLLSGEDGLHLL